MTGVQTCALPISRGFSGFCKWLPVTDSLADQTKAAEALGSRPLGPGPAPGPGAELRPGVLDSASPPGSQVGGEASGQCDTTPAGERGSHPGLPAVTQNDAVSLESRDHLPTVPGQTGGARQRSRAPLTPVRLGLMPRPAPSRNEGGAGCPPPPEEQGPVVRPRDARALTQGRPRPAAWQLLGRHLGLGPLEYQHHGNSAVLLRELYAPVTDRAPL